MTSLKTAREAWRRLVDFTGYLLAGLVVLALVTPGFEVRALPASARDVEEMADLCMLSERLLKDYALIGMGVHYHNPEKDLEDNLQRFERYLGELRKRPLDTRLKKEIGEIVRAWEGIRPLLQEQPDTKAASDLHRRVDALSRRCERIALDLAASTGIRNEDQVVLIAELGMLSQRLAARYMLRAWGVDVNDYDRQATDTIKAFDARLQHLLDEPDRVLPSAVRTQLTNLEKPFKTFAFMATRSSGRFVPSLAERNATRIHQTVRRILKLEEDHLK